LLWFRRKKKQQVEQAPTEAAAPDLTPSVSPPPAEGGAEPAKPRRRRGSRGGRGRTKKAAAPETVPAQERPTAAPRKPEPQKKPERKATESERRSSPRARRRIQPKRATLPAARRELLVSVDVGEQRVAVLEDDRVAEVYLERPERRSIAGNVYLGRVENVLPGMEAAFVEIGLEKNGFLYVDEIVVPELEGKRHGKKIQDLIARGETILVQAVKDPMKTKGARLTTEISLPGRFVVFVPNGEGLGVSRRLPDDERIRLRDILKALAIPSGGVIVRTAAEGASAEDVELDLVFLQRLWKSIQARAKGGQAPALVYQEAELPLRVIRDLFTDDFERALVDHERTHKRIVGYLRKTSPHMVERVVRYKEKTPLFEGTGVDAEIRSTLSRRVDLPSGGYLIFDYAEAFTVIDVNTGRFVGSRSKSSGARLEDTITKNNLEAVKEVVRQLRLRDIGGIIVIDFIDMANPRNRATVEEALRGELERDRTKTYVVEISPLGLVEMTRQNVTEGPREILTRKCPTCAGDGVVLSESSAAVDIERELRALASGSRTQAFRVEVNPRVAGLLVGPGARRLVEIEAQTRRRFFLESAEGSDLHHFRVVAKGKLEVLRPEAPVAEGDEIQLNLVEVGLHDPRSGVGKVDGFDVTVGEAAQLVGKKVKARVERVLDGTAYATRVGGPGEPVAPLTAEAEAERPTRAPKGRPAEAPVLDEPEPEAPIEGPKARTVEPAAPTELEPDTSERAEEDGDAKPRKRTRRGSRGARGRAPKQAQAPEAVSADVAEEEVVSPDAAEEEAPAPPRIHVPSDDIGEHDGEAPTGEEAEPKPKKRARRGTRGGRGRKRKSPAGATVEAEASDGASPSGVHPDYVPMSEWEDEVRT
jgi:ribonuclease G